MPPTVEFQLFASSRIPPLAWIAIAIVVLLTLALYFILFALLRAKNPSQFQGKRGMTRTAQDLAKFEQVMRDPMAKERGQLNELSRLVEDLKKDPGAASREKGDGQDK